MGLSLTRRLVMADTLESRVLAFDVGGSHVATAVCFAPDFRLGPVFSAPHASVSTSGAFLDLLHDLGMKAGVGSDGKVGAMLAVPGPFDLQAGVSLMRHKLPYLYESICGGDWPSDSACGHPMYVFSMMQTRICWVRSERERRAGSAGPWGLPWERESARRLRSMANS